LKKISRALCLSLLVIFLLVPASLRAEIIEYIVIHYPSISPNGDGVRDSSPVEVSLPGQALFLSVTLEDTLQATVYDTLLSETSPDAGLYATTWNGTNSLGFLLPEGEYRLVFFVTDGDTTETYVRNVVIDITAPVVTLDRIEPGVYTPGMEGTPETVLIYFDVSGLQNRDTLTVTVTDPLGLQEAIPHDITTNGLHSVSWSADASAQDGLYSVDLRASDGAGNSSSDKGFINVDTRGPEIVIIDPVPAKVNSVPLVQTGSCYDRNGIDDPMLAWNSGEPFVPADLTWQGDTLFWSFDLMDSTMVGGVYVERSCTLEVLCADLLGQEESELMTFTVDLTPPQPPVLNQPVSPVHLPEVRIGGVASGADTIMAFRAAGSDTISGKKALLTNIFVFTFDVLPGQNEFWAIASDQAGNRSEPSNVVLVVYDDAAGLYYPEAFRGPDSFEILTPTDAQGVEITIFTVTGERVARLRGDGPSDQFEIEWDLTNDNGNEVRNGAYLVVIEIRYDTGTTVDKSFIAVVR
jgi:flagellar hook assembly protein FlgD